MRNIKTYFVSRRETDAGIMGVQHGNKWDDVVTVINHSSEY